MSIEAVPLTREMLIAVTTFPDIGAKKFQLQITVLKTVDHMITCSKGQSICSVRKSFFRPRR